MQKHLKLSSVLLTMTLLAGCATRTATVVNQSNDVVRLLKPAKARVATTRDGKTWQDAGTMTIPAGWYATPGPKD